MIVTPVVTLSLRQWHCRGRRRGIAGRSLTMTTCQVVWMICSHGNVLYLIATALLHFTHVCAKFMFCMHVNWLERLPIPDVVAWVYYS